MPDSPKRRIPQSNEVTYYDISRQLDEEPPEVVDHEIEQWVEQTYAPTLYDRMTKATAITFTIAFGMIALLLLAAAIAGLVRLAVWLWP